MEKKFYCYVCDPTPCVLTVKDPSNSPFACPFDKKHNAIWQKNKLETTDENTGK